MAGQPSLITATFGEIELGSLTKDLRKLSYRPLQEPQPHLFAQTRDGRRIG